MNIFLLTHIEERDCAFAEINTRLRHLSNNINEDLSKCTKNLKEKTIQAAGYIKQKMSEFYQTMMELTKRTTEKIQKYHKQRKELTPEQFQEKMKKLAEEANTLAREKERKEEEQEKSEDKERSAL